MKFAKVDYSTGAGPIQVLSADFNHDGLPDLITLNQDGNSVSVLLARADGSFNSHIDTALPAQPKQMTIGDFNGDGVPDVAVASATGGTTILLGRGDGTFTVSSLSASASGIAAGDFNGDRITDLALLTSDSTINISYGTGNGSFQPGPVLSVGPQAKWIVAGDFNGDGRTDLAYATCCGAGDIAMGNVVILLAGVGGSFNSQTIGALSAPGNLQTGDYNHDGLADLIVPYSGCHTPCQGFDTFAGSSSGTMPRDAQIGTSNLYYAPPASVVLADFDGNGTLDAALTSAAGDYESSLASNNDRIDLLFGVQLQHPEREENLILGPQRSPLSLALGDFNRDGRPDLALASKTTSTVTVMLNQGVQSDYAGDFTIEISQNHLSRSYTVRQGKSIDLDLFVDPVGYAAPVTLSCSGLPTGASCSFSNNPVTNATSFFSDTKLTITTTGPSAGLRAPGAFSLAATLPFGFCFASLLLPVGERGRKIAAAIVLLLLAALCLYLAGCAAGTAAQFQNPATGASSNGSGSAPSGSGSGASAPGTTPAGSYTITVNASAGSAHAATVITLTVQ